MSLRDWLLRQESPTLDAVVRVNERRLDELAAHANEAMRRYVAADARYECSLLARLATEALFALRNVGRVLILRDHKLGWVVYVDNYPFAADADPLQAVIQASRASLRLASRR